MHLNTTSIFIFFYQIALANIVRHRMLNLHKDNGTRMTFLICLCQKNSCSLSLICDSASQFCHCWSLNVIRRLISLGHWGILRAFSHIFFLQIVGSFLLSVLILTEKVHISHHSQEGNIQSSQYEYLLVFFPWRTLGVTETSQIIIINIFRVWDNSSPF